MQEAIGEWSNERIKIVERWLESGQAPTARAWEQEFFEYTQRTPKMAALWGFAVISLESDSTEFETTMKKSG